jgi:hypothetical protein
VVWHYIKGIVTMQFSPACTLAGSLLIGVSPARQHHGGTCIIQQK